MLSSNARSQDILLGVSYNTVFLKQCYRLSARTPRRCRPASWLLPYDIRQDVNTLLEHISLLLLAERRNELVRVTMQSNLMAFVDNLADLLWERLC